MTLGTIYSISSTVEVHNLPLCLDTNWKKVHPETRESLDVFSEPRGNARELQRSADHLLVFIASYVAPVCKVNSYVPMMLLLPCPGIVGVDHRHSHNTSM